VMEELVNRFPEFHRFVRQSGGPVQVDREAENCRW
jgi:hypothetical protein